MALYDYGLTQTDEFLHTNRRSNNNGNPSVTLVSQEMLRVIEATRSSDVAPSLPFP